MAYEEILVKQNPQWRGEALPQGIERSAKKAIAKYLGTRHVLVLTGARRSGKSYLLFQLIGELLKNTAPENILYANFDDPSFTPLLKNPAGLDDLYGEYLKLKNPKGHVYFFMDEVQSVAAWEKWVKAEYDRGAKIKFIVTGSNSTLLSSELATLLTGRHLQFEVFPFSFEEFLRAKGETAQSGEIDVVAYEKNYSKKGALLHYLHELLEFGAFPEAVLSGKGVKEALLKRYYGDIIYRDVAPRFEVRDTKSLEEVAYYLATNISNATSYNRLANAVGINEKTVKDYMAYFERAYLFFQLPAHAYSAGEQIKSPKKIYCIDTGLRNAVSMRFSGDVGRLAENLVFIDLRARGKEAYYWKGKQEVDFAIIDGRKVGQLLQVSWNTENKKTFEREKNGLLEAMDTFKLDEGLIITEDKFGKEAIGKKTIRYVPIWAWLLRN